MRIEYKEIYAALEYLKAKGWSVILSLDVEITPTLTIPFMNITISKNLYLTIILNDTYYVNAYYKKKFKQIRYSPTGNITTTKEELVRFKNKMNIHEGNLFMKLVEDLYYFFKPNSINFIME